MPQHNRRYALGIEAGRKAVRGGAAGTLIMSDPLNTATVKWQITSGNSAAVHHTVTRQGAQDWSFGIAAGGTALEFHNADALGGDTILSLPTAAPGAIADASGGVTQDAEARTALNALLARMRTVKLIGT